MSIMGKPMTKKRVRFGFGIRKNDTKRGKKGSIYQAKYTPDNWYEDYIREAFRALYPGAKPIGWSLCEDNPDMDAYDWVLKKGVRDKDLPSVELDIVFYFESGKVGDLDNYIKAIKDALNQYAWIDDRQVHHYKPYLVVENDFVSEGYDPEPTRVDIYIRNFNLWENKVFLLLRKFMKKHARIYDNYDYYSGGEEE